MTDETTITRATAADFLDVAALDRVAWAQNDQSEFIPDGEHVWRVWCELALVYVARRSGRLLGAILAFPIETEVVDLPLTNINGHGAVTIQATFRGATCLKTSPLDDWYTPPTGVRVFDRPQYAKEEAPMRTVPYRIVERPVQWY